MSRRSVNTEELSMPKARDIEFPDNIDPYQDSYVEIAQEDDIRAFAEAKKLHDFMNEQVLIVLNESSEKNAPETVQLAAQGLNQFLVRGVEIWVKRIYVEALARARAMNLTTPEFIDSNGNRSTKISPTFGLVHNFQVIQDPNPDGFRWLQQILREG